MDPDLNPSLAYFDPRYYAGFNQLPGKETEKSFDLPTSESQNELYFLLKSLPREIANWLTSFPFIPTFEENGAFSRFIVTSDPTQVNIHHIVHREHVRRARRGALPVAFDLDGLPRHPNFFQNNQNPNHILNLVLIQKDFHRSIHTIPKEKLEKLKRDWSNHVKNGHYSKEFSTYLYELKLEGGFVDWDSRFDWSLYFTSIFINGIRLLDNRLNLFYKDFPWEYYQDQKQYIIESYRRIKVEYPDLFGIYTKSLNKALNGIETFH